VLSPPSKYVAFAMNQGTSPAVGPKDAKVQIYHYSDYQCPFCSKIVPTLEKILTDYPKDVRIVYKQHPLAFHPNAMPAAEAALAANAQGKFAEMNKKLFANQQQLTRDNFIAWAKEIGLDVARFTKEIDDHTYQEAIKKDASEAEGLGASGTPASFVNGRYLSGAKPYEAFKAVIDEELAWAKAGNRPDFKIGKNVSEASVKPQGSAGPDPGKAYDIPAGDAPYKGPDKAKVVILHYYDYQ